MINKQVHNQHDAMAFSRISRNLAGFNGNYTKYIRIGSTANFISETSCKLNPHTFNFEKEIITYKQAVSRGYVPYYKQRGG